MKRFITVLSSLLVLPAFAEVAPVYYEENVEYTDDMLGGEEIAAEEAQNVVQQKSVAQRNTINRSTSASRAISSATNSGASRTNTSSRAVAASPRSTTGTARGTASRTARTNSVVSRSSASRASVTSRGTQNAKPVTARVGTFNNSVMPGVRSDTSYASQSMLEDSGTSLYNSNSVRVGVTGRRTSARVSSLKTSTTPVITEQDVSETTTNLTALAELTDYCKAQYAACMDNYCNVLDDNQGRCSCSKNIKNYAKTELALSKATEDFQEVVQKIKYIGLTGPQIEALFAETEAELKMSKEYSSDNSKLRTSLDAIKKKIVDVSSPAATSYEPTSSLSFDVSGLLSADVTDSGFDLSSFLGGNSTNTSSVSNQRGEQLYKTATNRCKTAVLNSCSDQGIDPNVITNSYDLEIDKQCIAYERSLNEANTEMRKNITNAGTILQQARLLLTQNRNSYDLRGCVSAIDACMQDEYVCGADYELCLDPTGKYLANGEIVKGGTPGVSGGQNRNTADYDPTNTEWTSKGMYDLYATWNYGTSGELKNAWSIGAQENLGGYINDALATWKDHYTDYKDSTRTDNMALYLLQKIGYIDSDDKVHGMCASAMKQCQDYTFNSKKSTKTYIPANEVVRQYLTNTLAKIKVQQDAILSDYAEGCRADVQSCLSTNGYDDSNTTSTTSRTAVNACASEIATCMSVGGYTPKDGTKLTLRAMNDWVSSMLISCPANYYLIDDGIGNGTLIGGTSTGSGDSLVITNTAGNKVECKYCPEAPVIDPNPTCTVVDDEEVCEYPSTNIYKQTLSAGGQTRSCSCPDGYTDYYDPGEEITPNNLKCKSPTKITGS